MKKTPLTALQILFSGQSETVTLVDGTPIAVFVRLMPERFLLDQFLRVMESGSATVELCTYVRAKDAMRGDPLFPEIPPPAGYAAVPAGWADNLDDQSLGKLYALAKKLNFPRAETLAKGRLSAKQQIAPLNRQIMEQVMPLVLETVKRALATSSTSTPSAPSSSASPASNS